MNQYQKILFDKKVYGKNLLESRSFFFSYRNEDDLKNNKTEEINLSGIWKGKFFDDALSDYQEYLLSDYDVEKERDVEVPLSCELQGFSAPQYVNTEYPFDGYNKNEEGDVLSVKNPSMLYWKDIEIEDLNDVYILDVKGFESGLFVYVNGIEVGYSENLYLDSEFDITSYLKKGKNRIGLLCFKYSSSSWLLDQDFFRFMGLFRDVTLHKLPSEHIFDVDVETDVSLSTLIGKAKIKLTGPLSETRKHIEVFDFKNAKVFETETDENQIDFTLEKVSLWSAEEPNLYTILITLKKYDETIEIVKEHFGFRKAEIKDGILLFNGKRMIIKGVNRHEWNPDRGRNVTMDDLSFDFDLLKRNNVNAIRTSHYPNRNEFYQMADKEGVYILDEACLESHGTNARYNGWIDDDTPLPGSKEEWITICIEKVKRMYLRDKNHPSIFMYSLGNEAGIGTVFEKMRETLLSLNKSLLIHYEGCHLQKKWELISDVSSTMYFYPERVPSVLAEHKNKPYIQCEYAHAMGNSCGNLNEYHQLVREYPSYQGGFIWDYIDQGLYYDGEKKSRYLHFGGDYSDKPNDHDFCCNGIIFADRKYASLSSKLLAVRHLYQPFFIHKDGDRIILENELLFLSSDYDVSIDYLLDGKEMKNDKIRLHCEPQKKVSLGIPKIDYDEKKDVALIVRVYLISDMLGMKAGDMISYQDFEIQRRKNNFIRNKGKLFVTDGHYNIGVECKDMFILFSKSNISFAPAGLISLKVKGEEYLSLTAVPTLFRPITNNDQTNDFLQRSKLSYAYSRYMKADIDEIEWKETEDEFMIRYHYLMDEVNKKGMIVTYCVSSSGSIHVKVDYEPLMGLDTLGEIGLHFYLPKTIDTLTYFGRELESYPDRKEGNELGIYHLNVKDGRTKYIYPQESGNREDTRYLELKNKKTSLLFSCYNDYFSFHFQEYSPFAIDDAKHEEELTKSNDHHLEIIGKMRGVGGDDSWGAPVHPEYEIDAKIPHSFEFDITTKA